MCSTLEIHDTPDYLNRRSAQLSIGESWKGSATRKQPTASKTSRLYPAKAPTIPKRSTEPVKNRASVSLIGRVSLSYKHKKHSHHLTVG